MIIKLNFEIFEVIFIKIKCYIYFDMDNYMGYDFYLNFLYQICFLFIVGKSYFLVMVIEGRLIEFFMGISKNLQLVGEKLKGAVFWFVYSLIFYENGMIL